jgi:hypothetical protein
MPTLLADLINAIPVAGRGDVISPESHNSLRDAIVAIVTELGGAVESRKVTLTFAPAFVAIPDHPPWGVNVGYAESAPPGNSFGWLPMQLPDGSRIQQLGVFFGGTGRLGSQMSVELQRQFIRGNIFGEPVANVSVENLDLVGSMERFAPVTADSLVGAAPRRDPRPLDLVNNDEFKYFVRAKVGELLDVRPRQLVQIFAIRVDCLLG